LTNTQPSGTGTDAPVSIDRRAAAGSGRPAFRVKEGTRLAAVTSPCGRPRSDDRHMEFSVGGFGGPSGFGGLLRVRFRRICWKRSSAERRQAPSETGRAKAPSTRGFVRRCRATTSSSTSSRFPGRRRRPSSALGCWRGASSKSGTDVRWLVGPLARGWLADYRAAGGRARPVIDAGGPNLGILFCAPDSA
jgi:hypothetical protein